MADLWMFGLPEENADLALGYLSDSGFEGVILSVPRERGVSINV